MRQGVECGWQAQRTGVEHLRYELERYSAQDALLVQARVQDDGVIRLSFLHKPAR